MFGIFMFCLLTFDILVEWSCNKLNCVWVIIVIFSRTIIIFVRIFKLVQLKFSFLHSKNSLDYYLGKTFSVGANTRPTALNCSVHIKFILNSIFSLAHNSPTLMAHILRLHINTLLWMKKIYNHEFFICDNII